MFYNGKNVLVKINDEPIFATEAQLSYEAQVAPYFEIGERYTNRITPENTIQGSFNFSYYFTGVDPIRNLLFFDGPVKFDFGGILQTGYIKNFTARLTPHSPVSCNADLIFFRSPTGSFSPVYSTEDLSNSAVHINQVSISNFNNQYITGSYLSANFTYSADIRPEIYVGDKEERRGVFGVKEIVSTIICDNLNPLIEISGKDVGVSFYTKSFDQDYSQQYTSTGFLTKKSFNAKADELLTTEISIRQFNIGAQSTIQDFFPKSASFNDTITITGQNLDYTLGVFLDNTICDEFTIINSNLIIAKVPRLKGTFNRRVRLLSLG